jgi:hypothetical protein
MQGRDYLEFQSVRIDKPQDIHFSVPILLPGGEYLVVFTTGMANEELVLKKIVRGDETRCPGWLLVARCTPPPSGRVECSDKAFTDTICKYPLTVYTSSGGARYAI